MENPYIITLAEAKNTLRVEHNLDDDYISDLIKAAEAVILRETGKDAIDAYDLKAVQRLLVHDFYECRMAHDEARKTVLSPVVKMILQSARVDDACI